MTNTDGTYQHHDRKRHDIRTFEHTNIRTTNKTAGFCTGSSFVIRLFVTRLFGCSLWVASSFSILHFSFAFSQSSYKIDSILSRLSQTLHDTDRVNTLNTLAYALYSIHPDSTILLTRQAAELAIQIDFRGGEANAYNNEGLGHWIKGDYDKALELDFKALAIYEELGDKGGMAASYNNIGIINYDRIDLDKALEFYLKALSVYEELGNKEGMASLYNNIGNIHADKGEYESALEFFFKSLTIAEALNNRYGMAFLYNNIGIIFEDKGDFGKALEYYFKTLDIRKELGDKKGMAVSYNNIGALYQNQNNPLKAREFLFKALEIEKQIKEKPVMMITYLTLSQCDSALGDYKGAYEYHKLFARVRDSIVNLESNEKMAEMQTRYETEKKEAQIKILEKDREVAAAENKRQRLLMWLIVAVAVAVAVIAVVIFRSLRATRKANVIIAEQKKFVEEKNRDIMDSIDYASRIQKAIFIPEEKIRETFQECFILYKPKDVVSGDFYYFETVNSWAVIAACDCTGHGVPGALMSMIGNSLLNEIVRDEAITNAGQVLDELNIRLIKALNPHGIDTKVKDGMDVALIAWNKEKSVIQLSGANRTIYYFRDGKITGIQPARFGIGEAPEEKNQFPCHVITGAKNAMVYLCSDGYETQFGGPGNKKFKTKNLVQLLSDISQKPVAEQKEVLEKTFEEWKGISEQTDDVTIIGIRV